MHVSVRRCCLLGTIAACLVCTACATPVDTASGSSTTVSEQAGSRPPPSPDRAPSSENATGAGTPTEPQVPQGQATLRIYQGLALPAGTVVASNDPTASIFFSLNPSFTGVGYLGAPHIFKLQPDQGGSLSEADFQQAPDYANAPVPGSLYAFEADDGRHYDLRVDEFTNQGRSEHYWRLTVTWEEIDR